MLTRLILCSAALSMAALASGCATRATTVDAQWVSPSIASKSPVRNVLVVAALRDSTQRMVLEDRLVEGLTAAGIRAVPSYRSIADTARLTEAQLRAAVANTGASHVLASSISGVTTDVRVTQGMVMGPGWGPGGGWTTSLGPGWTGLSSYYSGAWTRSITADVRTTQNLHGDTRLFDAAASEVVWSAATT